MATGLGAPALREVQAHSELLRDLVHRVAAGLSEPICRLVKSGKKDRNWAVIDPRGQLVCLTVYKRGAVEVVRRLAA